MNCTITYHEAKKNVDFPIITTCGFKKRLAELLRGAKFEDEIVK